MLANFNLGVFILEPKPLTHAQVESWLDRAPPLHFSSLGPI
jgi:hypothetical protein